LEKERAVKFTAEDRPVFRFFRLGLHVLKFLASILLSLDTELKRSNDRIIRKFFNKFKKQETLQEMR